MKAYELLEYLQQLTDEELDYDVKIGPVAFDDRLVQEVLRYSPLTGFGDKDHCGKVVISPNPPLTDEQIHNAFYEAA